MNRGNNHMRARGVRPCSMRAGLTARSAVWSAACVLALALSCLLLVAPGSALASYKDVTDTYSATQPVDVQGSAIPASKVPDGSYPITATTSSYMCRMTNCTLTAKGGKMSVTFTLSKAYTRLYFGTAEEAASKTNADGTDDSAYYKGTPPDGYAYHVYTLPISQLNYKMKLATYAGGTSTQEWFSREVVFNSSAEVEKAVATGKSPGTADEGKDNGKKRPGGNAGASSGTGSGKKSSGAGTAKKNTGGSASAGSGKATAGGSTGGGSTGGSDSGTGSGGTAASGSGAGASADSSDTKKAEKPKQKKGDKAAGAASPKVKSRTFEVTPVAAGTAVASEIADPTDGDQEADDEQRGFYIALAAVAVGIAALAVVLAVFLRRIARMRRKL